MKPEKIAFRLNSDKAVEYANAHGEPNTPWPKYAGQYFHLPPLLVDEIFISDKVEEGYTDVTENFERDYWWPWKDMLDNCKLGEKCTCIKQTYTGCYNYALNKNEKIHIPLKNIDGHITVSGGANPELIKALNTLAENAFKFWPETPKQ